MPCYPKHMLYDFLTDTYYLPWCDAFILGEWLPLGRCYPN